MKGLSKTISVVLILGALLGFYGSAMSITDILDCKAYWEEEGEISTANLDKLDDGVSQLKENEKAYTDGVVKVAEGEVTLASGKAEYAAGKVAYAEGEQKLAAGKVEYAAGQESYASLLTLIAGLQSVSSGFQTQWAPGFYAESETSPGLMQARSAIVTGVSAARESLVALVGADLVDAVINAGDGTGASYAAFNQAVANLNTGLSAAVTSLETLNAAITSTASVQEGGVPATLTYCAGVLAETYPEETMTKAIAKTTILTIVNEIKAVAAFDPATQEVGGQTYTLSAIYIGTITNGSATDGQIATATNNLVGRFASVSPVITGTVATLQTNITNFTAFNTGYEQLLAGQQQIGGGLKQCLEGMLANEEMAAALMNILPAGLEIETLLNLYMADMPVFYQVMSGIAPLLDSTAIPMLQAKQADAEGQLIAAKKQLDEGEATLAASAIKLKDAEVQLADGEQELADGKKQLQQYEDGEGQLIDGMKQLLATKTYTGLKSIADRLGSSFSYMKSNNKNVDLTKAATAVKTGREFSADSTVKITKELTTRAYGNAAVIAAGVIAIIAAILGLLKKRKAAGVIAIIAAIAAGVGIYMTKTAGTEMSVIAGSKFVGFAAIYGGVAIAVLAVIAALIYFSAKEEDTKAAA